MDNIFSWVRFTLSHMKDIGMTSLMVLTAIGGRRDGSWGEPSIVYVCALSRSVVSNFLQPQGL